MSNIGSVRTRVFFFFFQPTQEAQPSTKTQKKKKDKFLRSTDSREIFFTFFSINDFLERDEFMIDVRINRYVFVQRTRPNRRQTLENAKNVPNCWLAKTMLFSATQLII